MEISASTALDNFLRRARFCCDDSDFGKAYAFYLLVLKLSPAIRHSIKEEFCETWREWSEKLLSLNKIQELVTLYDQGTEVYPDCDLFHVTMGTCYFKIGHKLAALNTFRRARHANPKNVFAKECVDNVCREIIDNWHYPMINDIKRNFCFRDSIHEYVAVRAQSGLKTDALDIGSGTGMMSMFAAQSGVDHVYACEMSPAMRGIAEEIIKSNGFSNTITNWNCYSTDITVADDNTDNSSHIVFTLPSRIPLVITETLDAGVIGEGIVKIVNHAWKQLLTEDGAVIPSRVKVMCLLVESEGIFKKHSCLCDVMPGVLLTSSVGIQNPFTTTDDQVVQDCAYEPYTSDRLSELDHRVLSGCKQIITIDFNDRAQIEKLAEESGCEVRIQFPIDKDGYLDAAVLYFELAVDKSGKHVISSEIGSEHCWEQAVYPFRDLRVVTDSCQNQQSKPGSSPLPRIPVRCGDNVTLRFSQESDKLKLMQCSVKSKKLEDVEYPQFIPAVDKTVLHVVLKEEEIEQLNDRKYWNLENCNNCIAKLKQCSSLARSHSTSCDPKQNGHKSTVADNGDGGCNMMESENREPQSGSVTVLILLEEFSTHPFVIAQLFAGIQVHICIKNSKLKKMMKRLIFFLGVRNVSCSSQTDKSIKYNAVFADVVESGGMMTSMVLENIAEARLSLKPCGIVFPNIVHVIALPVESEEFCQSCVVMNERNTLGLKIKDHMDCFQVTTRSHFAMHKMKHEALAEPLEIFTFHMNDKDSFPSFLNSEQDSRFLVTKTGKIHCILLWFVIELYDGHSLNTSDPSNTFLQSAILIKENDPAATVNAGDTVLLKAQCYRSYIAAELSKSIDMDCSQV